jgi:hypothetical protein
MTMCPASTRVPISVLGTQITVDLIRVYIQLCRSTLEHIRIHMCTQLCVLEYPPGGPQPQYPFLEIRNLLPCKEWLVRSVRNFTRITNVEIGAIILQKMPLSLRLKFVGNLSNTPAFPLPSQKSCDFFMFEPNSYYVQYTAALFE